MASTQGTVKWFNDAKGFGFITPDGNDPSLRDVFVHYSGIEGQGHRTLNPGDVVEYEEVQTPKGRAAEQVRVLVRNSV